MILQDFRLTEWAKAGGVKPFDPRCINPASIDLRLGHLWVDIERPDTVIDALRIVLYPRSVMVDVYNKLADLLHLPRKSTAILATTRERIFIPYDMAGSIKLKTTPSRRGLGHPIADWIDPGFEGELTLMLHAHKPIELSFEQRIVQIVIFQMSAPVSIPYGKVGHYQYQTGPTRPWTLHMKEAMHVIHK